MGIINRQKAAMF